MRGVLSKLSSQGAGAGQCLNDAVKGNGGLIMLTMLALIVQLANTVQPLDNKLKQRAKIVQWVNTVRLLGEPRAVTIVGQANTVTRTFEHQKTSVKSVALGNTTVRLLALLIVKLVLQENTMTRQLKPAVNHALQGNITNRRNKHQLAAA
jgi:hypothetical protein